MACHEKLQIEHDLLQAIEENASENEARCQALKDQYEGLATTLTDLRQKLIAPFEKAIAQHLTDLMLDKAKLEVSLSPLNAPSEHGLDKMEFLFSANPGEPLKPLNQVGSGGELARVMLAIKLQTLQQSGEMLILDEIDAGLSGQALKSLADKLSHLSQHNQVMVVTHHPLLAAKASQHWHLQKGNATKNSTQVIATELTDKGEREEVLGLMASGESTQDDVTRQFIQTLLKTG